MHILKKNSDPDQMKRNIHGQNIPSQYKKFFWDVDFYQLDLKKHRRFILDRFLNYGTFDTFEWIFQTFNSDEVNEYINKKGIYSLSRNSLYFWKKIAKEKKLWKNS
jgi:Family of unknown function (DUF6922)